MYSTSQNTGSLKRLKSAKSSVKKWVKRSLIKAKMRLGLKTALQTTDRRILERTILPYFAAKGDCHRILFVGCEWYTKHYENFFKGSEYWTIEIDPQLKEYGAKYHVVDALQNLDLHFEPHYFDLIIYNGVFGWGIDTRQAADIAFERCFQGLRTGGTLVFGWNDLPERCPFPPSECPSFAKFEPFSFPPLSTSTYVVPDSFQNHTFKFLAKP